MMYEPMWETEFDREIVTLEGRSRMLAHINYLRGMMMGYESKIKALEAELAEYKEMTAIARQYQRAVDLKWMRQVSRPLAANALEKETLDH